MPLSRYLIRSEYNLADPELYKSADKDDPEALLEGVAMAGLVGVLRQLGDLAEFAAEIFHDLHEEVMATAARGHDLVVRVQQLEAEFPPMEKSLLSQTNHTAFLYNPGFDWHSKVHMDENLVTQCDLPRFVMDNYEESRGPPRLFLLDKFDVAGAGACLKRYTDPSFIKVESSDSNTQKPEGQREKRFRKVKRRGTRWKIGDTPEIAPSSHAKLHQLLLEERIETGAQDPERRVKLKKRALDRFECNEESRKSYMMKFLDTCLPAHKVVHEISMDLVPWSAESNISCHSGLEIVKYDALSPCEEPLERDKLAYPPCGFPEVEKYSINEFNEVTDSKILEKEKDHEDDAGKILLMLSKEVEEEELAAVDSFQKSEVGVREYHSDVVSETDNFLDALATVDFDINIDSNSRLTREPHNLKIRQLDSDGSEELYGPQNPLDYHSVGNSTVSDDGSLVNKERGAFSCYDTASCVAESVQEINGYVAAKSSALVDQPSDHQNKSLVIQSYQKHDHVAGDTLENSDEKMIGQSEFDGRCLNSAKRRRGFAKIELKWVKRSGDGDVSHKNSMTCSISSAEDELQMPDRLLSLSQTDAAKDDSAPHSFERVKNSWSSVSSHSDESFGVVDLPMDETSTDAALVVNTASVSSLTNTEPAHMDLKDANMSSPEEQSQNLYSLVDLAHRSEKAETRISGVVDAGLQSQFDVAEEVVPCCGGDPNISLVSKANNGELMNESSFSTHTDGGETMDFKSCLGTGGPGIMGGTPGVDYTEMQSPGVPGYSKECLVEIKANKTSEVDYLEVGEGDAYEPAQLMVSGVGREADPETADVPLLVEEHTAETGILISQNMEEMPQELVVEEAESSLITESTDSSSASPTAYLDHQLKLKPKSRGDARLNGGLNEAAQKDPRVSVDEYDGQEVMNAGGEFPILSSTHSIGSLSVLDEEKPFTADQTASATMCVEAVVATTQDDNIKDEKTVAVPLSSLMDQPTSFCDRGHEESPCFEVHSYQNEEVSQTLPLKPLQEDMNHTADIWYELDQSALSHPHEQEQGSPFKDGSYQNEEACETLPLKAETEMEFQEGSSHVADVSLSSSSHYGMTLHDNFCRSSDTAPNPFLPSDRQDSFYSADGSDIDTATKSAVNLGQVLEPHVGNMVFSEQTDAGRLENPPAIKPSTSVTAPTSMLPDLIQGSQNTEITAQLISPLFPTLGVIPDLNNIKLDEMPPPPPLPPMQWRLGKSQQHASSVLYPRAVQSESDFSAAVLPTNNNADIRSPDPAGSQSWNPFMSCSSEDNQPKHFEDHLERSVELDSLDRVHDQSEQNLFQMAQPLDSQSHATCQDDLQPSDPGSMSLPGRVSSENDLFIEVSIQHTSASDGNGVIKEEMAVEDDKLPCVSSAVEEEWGIEASPELVDASIKEKVIKFETDDQLPVFSSADEQERTVLHEQLEHVSLVMEQGAVNPSSQFKQEIGAEGEKLELVPSAVEQERAIKASSEHTDPSGTKKVIKPETDVQDGKHPDIFAVGEQEQAILDKQLEDFSSVTEQRTDNPSSEFKEIAVQDEKLQLVSSEVVQEKAIKASSEVTDTFDEEKVIKVLIDVHDEKLSDISAAVEQDVSILDKQLEHVSLVTEQGTGISSSQFEEIAVQDEKLQLVSSDVVQARAIEASSEHTDAAYGEKLMKPEIDQVEELSDISAAAEQERVVRDEQLNYVLSVEQGTVNSSTQSKQEIAVQDEKLKHVLPPVELKRATEASSKHTDESNTEKVINQETDVQDDKLSDISPAEEQERVTRGEQLEHVSSAMGLGTVNLSRESNFPVSTKQGHLAQPGFISPEDQEAWSTNAFATIEPGNRNGDMQKKAPRPRNPLIDAVVAVDRSKLRKVGEISKSQDKLRAKEREQNLPQLRKVGERVKPRDGSRTEENIRNLPRLRRVEERTKPKDIPKSEGKELSLPQLRKVGDKVKSPGEAKSEGREQSLPQLRKVGGRVKHQDKVRSEEREQGLPRLRKVGERFKPRDESKSEDEKKSRLPALRKVEEIGDTQNESTSEEREQNISLLPKSGERVKQQAGSIADDRDSLMEQIRNKTFSLKPAVATRTNMPGPQTNLKVAAILQKANIIRQAMAGSDEDSDGWSDN